MRWVTYCKLEGKCFSLAPQIEHPNIKLTSKNIPKRVSGILLADASDAFTSSTAVWFASTPVAEHWHRADKPNKTRSST